MSKVIEFTDEQYRTLAQAAAARGQTLDALLAELIEELGGRDRDPRYYETDDWFRHLGATEEQIAEAKRMAATGRTLADRAATRFEHAIGRLVGDPREARQRHVTGDDKPKGGIRGHAQLHRVARDDLGDESGRVRMRAEEGWVATVDLALDFAEGSLAIAQLEDGPPRFAPRG